MSFFSRHPFFHKNSPPLSIPSPCSLAVLNSLAGSTPQSLPKKGSHTCWASGHKKARPEGRSLGLLTFIAALSRDSVRKVHLFRPVLSKTQWHPRKSNVFFGRHNARVFDIGGRGFLNGAQYFSSVTYNSWLLLTKEYFCFPQFQALPGREHRAELESNCSANTKGLKISRSGRKKRKSWARLNYSKIVEARTPTSQRVRRCYLRE